MGLIVKRGSIIALRVLMAIALTCGYARSPLADDPCATEREMIAMSAYEYFYSFGLTLGACDRKFGTDMTASFKTIIVKVPGNDPVANGGLESYAKKLGVRVMQLQYKLEHAVEIMRINIFPENFPNKDDCTRASEHLGILDLRAGVDEARRLDLKFAHQQGRICP
jgi:hypothetical protein